MTAQDLFVRARALLRADFLSARWLLLRSLVLALTMLLFLALGGRSEITVLSGNPASSPWGAFTGIAFGLTWLVFMVAGPALAIASGVAFCLGRLRDGRRRPQGRQNASTSTRDGRERPRASEA